jgi:C1A family cysteine protease
MPGEGDTPLGGHAVIICGYDMHTRRFRLQNCWGASWGDHGFFTVPFEYIMCRTLCWDLWTFVLAAESSSS